MAILGIHTDVPDDESPGASHAWVTLEKDGTTRSFGLYPDNQEVIECGQEAGWNGSGTHVREGIDSDRIPTSSIYQELTPEQEDKFWQAMDGPQEYSTRHNNCAHWASDTWEQTTGQNLEVKHQIDSPFETGKTVNVDSPIGLEHSIQEAQLEQNQTVAQVQTVKPESASTTDQPPPKKESPQPEKLIPPQDEPTATSEPSEIPPPEAAPSNSGGVTLEQMQAEASARQESADQETQSSSPSLADAQADAETRQAEGETQLSAPTPSDGRDDR